MPEGVTILATSVVFVNLRLIFFCMNGVKLLTLNAFYFCRADYEQAFSNVKLYTFYEPVRGELWITSVRKPVEKFA